MVDGAAPQRQVTSDLPMDCGTRKLPVMTSANQDNSRRRVFTPTRTIVVRHTTVLFLLSLAISSSFSPFADASWIDLETPLDKRLTQPYTAAVPNIPKKTKKRKKNNSTTPFPTTSPTTSPTLYPTAIPNTFHLVFSDEFNTPFRTFEDGSDPRWTALDKNDYTNDALHYYSARNAATNNNGQLVITTEAEDTDIIGYDDVLREKTHVTKHFRSAMVQSWNKFCFTGGIIEAEVELPGKPKVGGLWPAFWIMGNLARHTYVGTSEHIWPWSSTICTQKSFDSQLLSGCDEVAHYGLEPGVGRGAPEIDIFEVQAGNIGPNQGVFLRSPVGQPFMSASYQVAPGRPWKRPGNGYWPGPGEWYDGLKGGKNTSVNINFYGNYNHFAGDYDPTKSDYWSDAISFNRQLDASHFNGSHVYRLEWDVPTEESDGYLHWFLDGDLVLAINGTSIVAGGTGASISSEPSYIMMNTAVSSQWGFPKECPGNCPCKKYDCHSKDYRKICGFSEGFCDMMMAEHPPQYKINWVRVYQNPEEETHKVGCSTPERPTRRYIEAHEKLYKTEFDERPLKGIQRGRGACDPSAEGVFPESCGGLERGRCTQGKQCECSGGWTGPHCLALEGSDPILYDLPDKLSDVGFIPPSVAPRGLFVGFAVLILLFLANWLGKSRMDEGWTPIPDVEVTSSKFANHS